MYGPPGTGKTMLAKAVANATTANFIQVVASEFVQKWLGDGPRMVRDIFSKARENAPCIIFIDEVGQFVLMLAISERMLRTRDLTRCVIHSRSFQC